MLQATKRSRADNTPTPAWFVCVAPSAPTVLRFAPRPTPRPRPNTAPIATLTTPTKMVLPCLSWASSLYIAPPPPSLPPMLVAFAQPPPSMWFAFAQSLAQGGRFHLLFILGYLLGARRVDRECAGAKLSALRTIPQPAPANSAGHGQNSAAPFVRSSDHRPRPQTKQHEINRDNVEDSQQHWH